MRNEKRPLFKKEAKEEALHFGLTVNNDDDDEIPNMVIASYIFDTTGSKK